jgi:hypothetical protein
MGKGPEATSPLALHLLGILRAHEGRYEEAGEAFLRAINADPEMVGSYVELGLVYACRGEYGKMIEALRQAVEVGPGGVRAYSTSDRWETSLRLGRRTRPNMRQPTPGVIVIVRVCNGPWLQPCHSWRRAVTAKRRRCSNRLLMVGLKPRRPRRGCSL